MKALLSNIILPVLFLLAVTRGDVERNQVLISTKNFELLDLTSQSAQACQVPDYPFPITEAGAMWFDEKAGGEFL